MAKGRRKKGLRKHERAIQRGRAKRKHMRQLLAQYAVTGNWSLLSEIRRSKGRR